MKGWADEQVGSDPLPALEPFYILAALELGDPDGERWLERNAHQFHQLYNVYRINSLPASNGLPGDSASVLIQYMIWYDRDSRRLKEGNRQ